jgi:phosphatidylserine decarboxylase
LFYYIYFLRQPQRTIPSGEDFLVSPANGRVIAVLQTEEDFLPIYKNHRHALTAMTADLKGPVTMISIMMTPMHVHYQRAPHDATLISQSHHRGRFRNAVKQAKTLESTMVNENNQMTFEHADGSRYTVIQIAGYMARRIVSYIKPGQHVTKGEVIGLIKLGSQVTIILDSSYIPNVQV